MVKIKIPLTLLLMSFSIMDICGNTLSSYTVTIVDVTCQSEPNPKDYPIRHRLPIQTIQGTISLSAGVMIPGLSADEILSYELCYENRNSIAEFSDEMDFINLLFSSDGTYMVRFITDEYIYTGYISIN